MTSSRARREADPSWNRLGRRIAVRFGESRGDETGEALGEDKNEPDDDEPEKQPPEIRGERERQQIIFRLAARPRRRPNSKQPVVAAGDVAPLERYRPDDLREGERQHGEIDPGQADAKPAEEATDDPGGERCGDETDRHRCG